VDAEQFLWIRRADSLWFRLPSFPENAQEVLRLLTSLPFERAAFSELYAKWVPEDYEQPRFHEKHYPVGWACAFRSAGHEALVSRRWLDFGPWRVLRGPGDTTLVQFHELGVDAATALVQQIRRNSPIVSEVPGGMGASG
jgi:hypothetical protein